jgi:Acetyltransferase (GNAT) domain
VSRQRDHAGGRVSLLDDAAGRLRWTSRLAALAAIAHLELSTLRIHGPDTDGVPAAYVLGVVEHGCYRVVEGRFAIEWKRYSPGRLLEADVLQRVLVSDDVATLDWMTSVAPESLLSANAAERLVVVDVVF